jgi:hypothetical protein
MMTMPRNNTTSHTVLNRRVRLSTGRHTSAAAKPGSRRAAIQPPQQAPGKPPGKQQAQQPRQQASSTAWQEPLDDDYEPDEKAEWADAVQSAQSASKVRQRIEMLREERLLQQALIDTFDL